MDRTLKIVIAGASGIGKHHAKWHHEIGNNVVGFLGRDDKRCKATLAGLKEIFDFSGHGYWDFECLLDEVQPDIVDICTPHELHYDLTIKALTAGAHVLCEKPLFWSKDLAPAAILAQAWKMVDLAQQQQRILGVCTQYAASLPHYFDLYEKERGTFDHPVCFYAEMETLARGQSRDVHELWIDMGSHPLSLLLSFMPEGTIDPDSLRVEFRNHQAHVQFIFVDKKNRCQCEIIVRDIEAGQPRRSFGVNEFLVNCSGRPDRQGVYRSVLQRDNQELISEDSMASLIRQFDNTVAGHDKTPLVPGVLGYRNLELQLQIWAAAQKTVTDQVI